MVFFCHGTGFSNNSSSKTDRNSRRRRTSYKNRNYAVRKIRARTRRYVTSPSSEPKSTRSHKNNQSHQHTQGTDLEKLQEETETDALHVQTTEVLYEQLEEVPFEVIEAEDILLWGCPPHKIPKKESQTSARHIHNIEKAASVPAYRKCCHCHNLSSSSEQNYYEVWNATYDHHPIISQQDSAHSFQSDIPPQISWCTFNPFNANEILENITTFNEFESFAFPQLFHMSSCQVYDVPVEDEKAIICIHGQKRTEKIAASIIHDYSSDNEECQRTENVVYSGNSITITEVKNEDETSRTSASTKKLESDKSCSRTRAHQDSSTLKTQVLYEGSGVDHSCTLVADETNERWLPTKTIQETLGVRILHSLPGMFTICNVDTSDVPDSSDHKHRRRKAVSVAITDQCHDDYEDHPESGNENLERSLQTGRHDSNGNSKESGRTNRGPSSNFTPSEIKDTTETLQIFKALEFLSSSKLIPVLDSAQTIHRRSRSSPSVTSTGTLLSFSPDESFMSSVETSPVQINIAAEDTALTNYEELSNQQSDTFPGSSDSIDAENNFYKFYPPPTPMNKSSLLKNKPTGEQKIEQSDSQGASLIKTILLNDKAKRRDSHCVICNPVFFQVPKLIAQPGVRAQKSAMNKPSQYTKTVSSVKFKLNDGLIREMPDVESTSGDTVNELSVKASKIKSGAANPLAGDSKKLLGSKSSRISEGSKKCKTKSSTSSDGKSCDSKSSSIKFKSELDEQNNNNLILCDKGGRLSVRKIAIRRESKVKPASFVVGESESGELTQESTQVLKQGRVKQTSSSSMEKPSMSSSLGATPAELNNCGKPVKMTEKDQVPLIKSAKKLINSDGNSGLASPLRQSRRKVNTRRRSCPSTSCSSKEDDSHHSNFKGKGMKSIKNDRRSRRHYYPSHSESGTDPQSSDESKHYRKRRRRKKRRKQNLWQKMIQYFFGCECHKTRTSKESLPSSCTSGYYGADYKPQISFFERIVIWWRKKTHKQIVVRQDSVQLFRLKRRQWLKEIHEFYEDLDTVNKNIRAAERSRRPSNKKKTAHYVEPPIAKLVNSEGCILLRNQGANIDILNGNKPKEKKLLGRPVKGILKTPNPPTKNKLFH